MRFETRLTLNAVYRYLKIFIFQTYSYTGKHSKCYYYNEPLSGIVERNRNAHSYSSLITPRKSLEVFRSFSKQKNFSVLHHPLSILLIHKCSIRYISPYLLISGFHPFKNYTKKKPKTNEHAYFTRKSYVKEAPISKRSGFEEENIQVGATTL